MRDNGYWIILSVGWNPERPRGRRWDATVVGVRSTDELGEPDFGALAAERPERLIAWGVWSSQTGWAMCGQEGPRRLVERFASVGISEQGPFRAAVSLGVEAAMRLALGLSDRDRDPFPDPGNN